MRKAPASTSRIEMLLIDVLLEKSRITEQSNALNNEEESPANHTKSSTLISWSMNVCFLPKNFLPVEPAKPEKKERCIPLNAKICDKPASRKFTFTDSSK